MVQPSVGGSAYHPAPNSGGRNIQENISVTSCDSFIPRFFPSHSIIWECIFGKAIVGLSPEQSLALFMEIPAISLKVVSQIPPEVFENLDTLNESVGTILRRYDLAIS